MRRSNGAIRRVGIAAAAGSVARPKAGRYDAAVAELVVVSGAPASGKTTLARTLGRRLGLVVLEKDALKEALADAVGLPDDIAASTRIGSASYAALFSLARELLAAEVGVLIESNFRRDFSEAELALVATVATSVHLVHCTAASDLIARRYQSRSRHPAHLDSERHAAVRADLAAGRYEPLRVAWPTVVVQTDSGFEPTVDEIAAFITPGGQRLRAIR